MTGLCAAIQRFLFKTQGRNLSYETHYKRFTQNVSRYDPLTVSAGLRGNP